MITAHTHEMNLQADDTFVTLLCGCINQLVRCTCRVQYDVKVLMPLWHPFRVLCAVTVLQPCSACSITNHYTFTVYDFQPWTLVCTKSCCTSSLSIEMRPVDFPADLCVSSASNQSNRQGCPSLQPCSL
jgi:hypothetical protein